MEIDRKEFIDFLIDFEKNNSVENWHFNGMDLWPIVKRMAYYYIKNLTSELKPDHEINKKLGGEPTNKRSRFIILLSLTFRILSIVIAKLLIRRQKKHYPFILFGTDYFRILSNKVYLNPFFQPIINYSKFKYNLNPLVCDYEMGETPKYYGKLFSENFINRNNNRYQSLSLLMNSVNYNRDHFFDNFITSVNKCFPQIKGLDSFLKKKISAIYKKSFIYQNIFKTYKPKYAICLTFYTSEMFAMLFAASKLKIKTIDLAHGYVIQNNSIVYFRHYKIPKSGYNTFPDYFWIWDQKIAENFKIWINESTKHNLLIGGNTKLFYYINNMPSNKLSNKKVIFLTLNPQFPKATILETIRITDEEYDWWIRLHPSNMKQLSNLDYYLNSNGITKKYNLEDANRISIFEILKKCDVHLSFFSTAIFESMILGNTPILLDKPSITYYGDHINNYGAICGYNKSSDKLIELIKEAEKRKKEVVNIKPLHENIIDKMVNRVL